MGKNKIGKYIINSIGQSRKGCGFGGITWADIKETYNNLPLNLHQYVAHSKVEKIKKYPKNKNCSITYIDVLWNNTLKLNKEGEVDISSTTNIEASLGKYAKFAVLLNNSNNTKNILSDLKQVTVATKDNKNLNIISEVEESITYFKFLIPNDLNIGDYKFKVKVAGITKTLLVKVQKAKLEEIIKLKNSKEEKTINDLDVLKVNTSYFGNILAKYSNTDFFDITNTRHKNYSESAPTNIYKIRLASTSSSNIDFKLANNDADAFDNPLEIIAKVATDLDPVTLNLDIKDAADEYLTIAKKLYVGNKPKIESTVFQINSADAPNIKIAHGVDSTNKAKVSNGCATLSSVTYSLGGVSKPAVTDSSKFKVVLPEAEKGKEPLKEFIFDRVKFICSTASAKANQSYKVFVQASQDETVSKEVTFTVGDAVNTTDYIVSIDGNNKALGDDIILQLKAAGEDAFSNVITAHLLKSDSTVVSEGIISDDLAATFEFDNPAFSIVRDDTNKSNYRIKLTKAAIASAKGSPIVATMTLKQLTGHKLNVDRKNIRIVFTK